jgi:signal transduction histidine kinase
MIGRPVTDFVAEEYRDLVRRRQAAGVEGRFDATVISKSGERRIVEVITTNHMTGGRLVRLAALRDVTAIRRLEEQVQWKQKMEALGRLAGAVAHDFNNLLQSIRFLGSLLMNELDERNRVDLGEILKAADTGTIFLQQLVSFARQGPDLPSLIDVNAVVRDTERMVRRLVGAGISVVADLADAVGAVRVDPTQLQLVILTLAINAREAMPNGGTLRVRTRNVELRSPTRPGPGPYTLLELSDSGTGIPDSVKGRIFEPFFTTKADRQGTGIGLAIVRQVVEHSGGFVEVESAEGTGSTFVIHLPHADPAA